MIDTHAHLFVLMAGTCEPDDSDGGLIWIGASAALLIVWALLVTGFAVYQARSKAPASKKEGRHE